LRLWRRRFYCQSCGGSGCGAGSGLSEGKVVIARLDGDASLCVGGCGWNDTSSLFSLLFSFVDGWMDGWMDGVIFVGCS
jgi:hypothetical protein